MKNCTVKHRIERFNQGRNVECLSRKYAAMQSNIFSFFRGTAHLFYQDWPQQSPLNAAPLTWISGDLHLENFGCYKGDNRLTYFDINDFDEAVLAPCSWDLARLLCSLIIGAQTLKIPEKDVALLCNEFLDTYYYELSEGKSRWIERATATGIIQKLLKNLKKRKRKDLLAERTTFVNDEPVLIIDGEKVLAASAAEKQRVKKLIEKLAATQPNPEFFQVLDVARRVAGTSSLGLERFIILIRGKGARRHYLLDMKYQPGSALQPYLITPQPTWHSEAERVALLQHRGQAIAPAFLSTLVDGQKSYLIKELMPQQDKLNLSHWNGKLKRLQKTIHAMAQLVAWQHIRTGGWQGSAIVDQWQAFGRQRALKQELLQYAMFYSHTVKTNWLSFRQDGIESRCGI